MTADRLPSAAMGLLAGASALAAVALGVLAGTAPALEPVNQVASAQLADDDSGAALFTRTDLAPGHRVTRCMVVHYTGPAAEADIRLSATDVTGPLADDLTIRVRAGTGGGFADCTGFAGAVVFDGPLRGLEGGPAEAPGVTTGWRPLTDSRQTYEITVEFAATSQRQLSAATATLRWLLPQQPVPPEPTVTSPTSGDPDPAGTDPAGTDPTSGNPDPADPVPTEQASTDPTAPAGTDPAASAGPTGTPGGPGVDGADAGQRGADQAAPARRGTGATMAGILAAVTDVARRTLKHGALPAASLLAVIIFLVIQHFVDRQDPKLAVAPLWRDNYLRIRPDGPQGEQ